MPISDRERIDRQRRAPRIVALWQALQPLRSVVRFLNTGAHPDDETTSMLAALALRDGISVAFACANRGEGGQNDIGTETVADLGAMRTAEMEAACRVLGMRLYWLSESAEDSIFDFGFSKSGEETLRKWGRERTVQRFVKILRTERPDIVCPTFLDIPGQHGHHRAMTWAAFEAVKLASDPGYEGSALPVWRVAKLYLPAWSGAGGSYDDEVPPPPATVTVDGRGMDLVTGWSWAQIAQQSRACHATQGMGRWAAPGAGREWPLHLAWPESVAESSITDGLPMDLAALAEGAGAATGPLRAAQAAVEAAYTAFPEFDAVPRHAAEALGHVRAALQACPEDARDQVAHRLELKERELGRVLMLAAGVDVQGIAGADWVRPGEETSLTVERRDGTADAVSVEVLGGEGWEASGDGLRATDDAAPTDGYRATYDPLRPPAPALRVLLTVAGVPAEAVQPLVAPPVILPARSAALEPDRAVVNLLSERRDVDVRVSEVTPAHAEAALQLPSGWQAEGLRVTVPMDVAPGLYELPLTLDGDEAMTVRRIAYPHIDPTARPAPAVLRVRVLDVTLPEARVGYIGSGNDSVAHWLREVGVAVTVLTPSDLQPGGRLDGLDTLVIGIFAMRFREGLSEAMPAVHDWVAQGGTLLTLYHRPWDNWDPERTAPRRIEIGQPSLRWRVTDEAAAVTHLVPEHPLLTTPNRIGPEDWAGWHKERGLYFAKSWDPAYVPLLEMADPGETPHRGALLAADVGAGRHVHCALILHHQMAQLVPGAYRLMANLIALR